ncbi:MAG: RodZ domain-containing protein [Chloroflexia bacterium]
MSSLGEVLRAERESRGLSLADAERGTRIRQKYLSALEDDNPAALPGPTYARGFVRNYAAYLEIDITEALALYDNERLPTRERIKAARGEPAKPSVRRDQDKISIQPLSNERIDTRVRYGSQYITLSLLAIPLLIVFYFIYSAAAGPQSQPPPTPLISAKPPTITAAPVGSTTAIASDPNSGSFNTPTVLIPSTPVSPQQTITGTAVAGSITDTLTVTGTTVIPSANAVALKVVISGHESWMSVRVDGVQEFAGTLPIGTSRDWSATSTIQLRVGRADSVRVYVNGADRGYMGTPDNLIVEKKWDKTGNEEVIQP